ncbi:ISAzo13 family transposase [Streptomyces halobius]|uniref:ISAzo13 family transposase n=1 Tax=Streptomyces halobius TaxID=2879846 RepID=A0ABY4LYJ1_9ACTN|nr:ISAzo13 family transposase [Streptomyces halobius]UQA90574.1 ISAzo13 family transposase [Streptomyces halobius]UQA91542.1 ISAzo13 family transposase [Streptomyces halobius]UQA91970.1 ISAzo13 family transposase [Streptomyces halobius]
MRIPSEVRDQLSLRFGVLFPHLNERQQRLALATEARLLGHGGVRAVACAAGVSETTVRKGVFELEGGEDPLPDGRVRRDGGGRKSAEELDRLLVPALLALVEPDERGDPMSPLRWTTKSLRCLAGELTRQGHAVSAPTVGRLLRENGFSLQANAKTLEGAQHPNRDAQFRYINDQVRDHQAGGEPVVSVDTKKKEVVGQFKNAGREWRPTGRPVRVGTHDFPDQELGRAAPYGIYDITSNTGWVSVGCDHDTAAFAVESIRRWWNGRGRLDYPGATRLLIIADAGGSNGYRTRAWKTELAAFAAETGLAVTVCHMPPGTSKWNKVEHRLFSAITMNWRGRPLTSYEVVVQSIAATTTRTGLTVHAELDPGRYPTGVKVSDAEMNAVPLTGHAFHGEWNYTVHPRLTEPASLSGPTVGLDRGALSHPALTGMTSTTLTELTTALAAPWQALHAPDHTTRRDGGTRRRAPGGGRKAKLNLADRVLATALQQHLALPPTALARLFTVSKDTIREATGEIRQLMVQHGHSLGPAAAHLSTLTGLLVYATAHGVTLTPQAKPTP